jgi:hypothetical protein
MDAVPPPYQFCNDTGLSPELQALADESLALADAMIERARKESARIGIEYDRERAKMTEVLDSK